MVFEATPNCSVPPKLSDLPEEWQIAYDPTGNSVVRRGKNQANPINADKEWVCPICDRHYATIYSAAGHRSAEGGCPSVSLMKSFKPMSCRKAMFFDDNLCDAD